MFGGWDNIFKLIFLCENCYIVVEIEISQKFVPKGLISNKSLSGPMMAWFNEACKCHLAFMSQYLYGHFIAVLACVLQ